MALFQKSVVKKYLSALDDKVVANAFHKFQNLYFDEFESGELDKKSAISKMETVQNELKIFDHAFDSIFQQFGLTPADYERMSVEELAGMEVEVI